MYSVYYSVRIQGNKTNYYVNNKREIL